MKGGKACGSDDIPQKSLPKKQKIKFEYYKFYLEATKLENEIN